jgi:hypothetical protein
MTKKHFEALTAAMKASKPMRHLMDGREEPIAPAQWKHDTCTIADVCARFNPNFDRARFLKACGVEG